ncbi:Glutamyl-tRNA(Gln) amidotransferase subunit A-like protein, partial [hydrothermal vent metagenome]
SSRTIRNLSVAIQKGKTDCVAVLNACFEKIDEQESQLHAWAFLDREGAIRQAKILDDELAAGNYRGALHGIPIGIKDIIDVANMPTAAGANWRKELIAKEDAPLVSLLRDAGAIILGKTVTTQFACFDPPVTRNPWDNTKTPGGSSSGSAVAVATGMCLGAIGTQTGGSITRPASFCGVCGFKPTFEKVNTAGIIPVSKNLDHAGPIAQTVDDLWLMYDVLSDNNSQKYHPLSQHVRIGQLNKMGEEKIDSDMRKVFQKTINTLNEAGAVVSEVALPETFFELFDHHWNIMAYDAAKYHLPFLKDHANDYSPGMQKLIEQGMNVSDETFNKAKKHQQKLKQEMSSCFQGCDILVTPATLGTAPDCSTTGNPHMNTPWSYTGLPTISFPVGEGSNGLPLAMQLIGNANAEKKLFEVARWAELIIS